jgi:DnaJ like chaperone protein
MAWKGKFFGAIIGFLTLHTIWGAIVGAVIGHLFDQSPVAGPAPVGPSISEVFFRMTFELMGHVAKSDGRVSEAEIDAARRLMQQLNLGPAEVAMAIAYFRAGKAANYDFELAVERLRGAVGLRHDLLRAFVELQLRAALAGDGLLPPARAVLNRLADRLGISALEFAHMEAVLRARQQYAYGFGGNTYARGNGGGANAGAGGNAGARAGAGTRGGLAQYYSELEVDAAVSDAEVTKAYRRQMSRHHPDKLVANGLPESMAQVAKEKTQRIQEAYEEIRAARGMR